MDDSVGDEGGLAVKALAREVELVRNAVAMVATGGVPRVSLAGLRFGDQMLRVARQMAEAEGVRVRPLWTADEAGIDLCIERSGDD